MEVGVGRIIFRPEGSSGREIIHGFIRSNPAQDEVGQDGVGNIVASTAEVFALVETAIVGLVPGSSIGEGSTFLTAAADKELARSAFQIDRTLGSLISREEASAIKKLNSLGLEPVLVVGGRGRPIGGRIGKIGFVPIGGKANSLAVAQVGVFKEGVIHLMAKVTLNTIVVRTGHEGSIGRI